MINVKIMMMTVKVQHLEGWGHLLKTAAPSWRTGPPSRCRALIGHTCVRWTVSSIGLTSGCPDITTLRFHLQMIRWWCAVDFHVKLKIKKKSGHVGWFLIFFFSVLSETHKVSDWASCLRRANTRLSKALWQNQVIHTETCQTICGWHRRFDKLFVWASIWMPFHPVATCCSWLRDGDEKSR